MKVIRMLGTQEILEMAGKIAYRQDHFGEGSFQALAAVLMNYGDKFVSVECINGEWRGVKGELSSPTGGIPKCPNGHVLLETSLAPRIALIEE